MKNKRTKQIKVYLNDEENSYYEFLKNDIGLNMNQFFRNKLLEKYEEENGNDEKV